MNMTTPTVIATTSHNQNTKQAKVDPRLSSLVSSVCSSDGNVKDNIIKVLNMLVKHQTSFVPVKTEAALGDSSSLYDCSDVPLLAPELVYAIKRAIRGCASVKEECRIACSLFLTALLQTFAACLNATVLLSWQSALLSAQSVGVGKAKADSRMVDIGKLCVSMVLMRSTVFAGFEETVLKTVLEIRSKKSYFALPCDSLVLEFVERSAVDPKKQQQLCKFLLPLVKDQKSLLFAALSSFQAQGSVTVAPITNESREVLDVLPRLHPALKVIAKNRFSVLEPFVDDLLNANNSRELRLIGVLLMAEAEPVKLTPAFVALAERLESQKRSKSVHEDALKETANMIINKFAQSLNPSTFTAQMADIPMFIVKRLPLSLFEQIPIASIDALLKTDHFDAAKKSEIIYSILRSRRSFEEPERDTICKALFATDALAPKVSALLSSVSHDEVKPLCAAISKHYQAHCSDAQDGPIKDCLKVFKKLSSHQDANVVLTANMIVTILALTQDPSCFEMMEELKGFAKTKSPSDDECVMFWMESVMTLLSMNSAFIRRLAEILFINVVGTCKLTGDGVEPVFEAIDKKVLSSDSFELAQDDHESDSDKEEEEHVEASEEELSFAQADFDSHEEALDDDEMEALDDKLAAAVSMHIKSKTGQKAAKMQLLKTEQAIQSKAVSLVELIGRAKELSVPVKFFFLPRIIKSLVALEGGAAADRKVHAERLAKASKNILDSCRSDASLPWKAALEQVFGFTGKRDLSSGLLASILAIALRHNIPVNGIFKAHFEAAVKSNEGISEVSCVLKALANHNVADFAAAEIEPALPITFGDDIRAFSKSLLTQSLRMIVAQLKRPSGITDFVMNLICDGLLSAISGKSAKPAWIKGQIGELQQWSKFGGASVSAKLAEIKSALPEDKLLASVMANLK